MHVEHLHYSHAKSTKLLTRLLRTLHLIRVAENFDPIVVHENAVTTKHRGGVFGHPLDQPLRLAFTQALIMVVQLQADQTTQRIKRTLGNVFRVSVVECEAAQRRQPLEGPRSHGTELVVVQLQEDEFAESGESAGMESVPAVVEIEVDELVFDGEPEAGVEGQVFRVGNVQSEDSVHHSAKPRQ